MIPVAKATKFTAIVVFLQFKHHFKMGVYIFSRVLVIGFAVSGFNLPLRRNEINTGVKVIAKNASIKRIKVFVQARG
jgi:hypothetical protein